MQNYDRKKLIETILALDEPPSSPADFAVWLQAESHLTFLRENADADELVILASGRNSFIHSVVVPNERLLPIDRDDLMGWNFNAYQSITSYVWNSASDSVSVERGLGSTGTRTLEGATQLIFGRTFDGWNGPGHNYFELHQEYAHLAGIHWRPERRAYCRFDKHGDFDPVVSVTTREDKKGDIDLVTFHWGPLEEYLAASDSSLVRMFDFNLYRNSGLFNLSGDPDNDIQEADRLYYRRKVDGGIAAYTRGVQIIRPRRAVKAVLSGMTGWGEKGEKKYLEFVAYDWRNRRILNISTDPAATTNYFEAEKNALPYELSPAFFRPEVLSKYKADREKYTVGEREVSCRAAWNLRGIDVNEAGQVHAYIVYLRNLPYSEQLHWLAHNEPPKTGISERAVTTDFKGEFTNVTDPLTEVLLIARRWHDKKAQWWTLRDKALFDSVNTPITTSRDEWAEAFLALSKLVVEGFETSAIRKKLDDAGIKYEKEDRTIALLERLLTGNKTSEIKRLAGLRTAQNLRSKAKGHVGGSEAAELAQEALTEHETFAGHFKHVCQGVAEDLETIERLFA